MTRTIRPVALALLAAGAILMAMLLTGVLGGAGPASAGAATARHHTRTQHVQRHTVRQHSTKSTARTAQAADSDNIQSGDQNAPDNPAGQTESAGENESASEPAGEAQPGHEDPQGQQVDHQCPPSCAPGEQP